MLLDLSADTGLHPCKSCSALLSRLTARQSVADSKKGTPRPNRPTGTDLATLLRLVRRCYSGRTG
jgi:hypothetical protein